MNVKPGDLAIVIRDADHFPLAGRIVEVLSIAPSGSFVLPDSYPAQGGGRPDHWTIKFTGAPIVAQVGVSGRANGTRTTFYGVVPDRVLRPVSGLPDTEDTTTEQPIKETA